MRETRVRKLQAIQGLPYWRVSLQDYIVDNVLGWQHIHLIGIRILDLGCGLGYTLARLSQLLSSESQAIGIDIERRNISKALRMVGEFGDSSRVKIYCANAERMPFPDDHFDIVIANLSFSVIKDARKAASEVLRVLKPGGDLIVSEVSNCSFLGKMGTLLDALTHHLYYRLYSPMALSGLFTSHGLQAEKISRIPLAVKIRGKHLRVPPTVSPLFSIEFSKPPQLNQNRRVN